MHCLNYSIHAVLIFFRIPEEVRPHDYGGPKELPVELSTSDRKYIVALYSSITRTGI